VKEIEMVEGRGLERVFPLLASREISFFSFSRVLEKGSTTLYPLL
jgi:hypothetical protein